MRTTRWTLFGLILLSGCAAGGGGGAGGDGQEQPVGTLTEDGQFVSQSLGYSVRVPEGWELYQTQVNGSITTVSFVSEADGGSLAVSAGPPSEENAANLEADTAAALEAIARQVAEQPESNLDAASLQVVELASGQPAVVLDILASEQAAGGRVLLTYGNDLFYTLTIAFAAGETGFDPIVDEVVGSFRLFAPTPGAGTAP